MVIGYGINAENISDDVVLKENALKTAMNTV